MELNEADLWTALEEPSLDPLSVSPGELRAAVVLLLAAAEAGGSGADAAAELAHRWARRLPT